MEIISEAVYWAVSFTSRSIGSSVCFVLGGCFIAGTIWSVLRHALFRPQIRWMSRRSFLVALGIAIENPFWRQSRLVVIESWSVQ